MTLSIPEFGVAPPGCSYQFRRLFCLVLSGTAAALLSACSSGPGRHATRDSATAKPAPADAITESGIFHGSPESQSKAGATQPQREKVEAVVRLVLDAHGFVPPVFIDGTDSVRWAISTRPGSQHELILGLVKMAPENEISVELVLYAHVGTSWAILGREFRGSADQEARQIENQMRERLAGRS